MSSLKKQPSPSATCDHISHRPSLRLFSHRSSSNAQTLTTDVQHQIEFLLAQLKQQTKVEEEAIARAREAEARVARLKELAWRFWNEEWSGMKDYVGLFNGDCGRNDIEDIEERVRVEYAELFGREGGEKQSEDEHAGA